MRLRQRILQAGGWVTAGFLLDKLIAAAQMMILARLLTPADFGLMAASAVVVLAVTTLSEFGIETALVSRERVSDSDLAVAWTLSLGRACVLTIGLWLFAGSVAGFFQAPELAALLRVHALAILIQAVQSPAISLLLRNLQLGQRVRLDVLRRLVEATTTVLLAVWLRSVWALLIGQLVGFAVSTVFSYRMAPFLPRLSLARDSLGQFLQFGKHLNRVMILTFGVTGMGEVVVGRLLGIEPLGLYQVAMTIPILIGTRAAVVMTEVSFPTYALLKRDVAGVTRTFAFQIGVLGLVLLPVAAGLAIYAREIVLLLFGARWLPAAEPLRLLCPYAVFACLCTAMASLHYGLNRPDYQSRIWSVQFLVYGLSIIPLTLALGLSGTALALTLSYAVSFGLHAVYSVRLIGTEAWALFARLGWTALWVTLISAVIIGLREWAGGPGAPWFLVLSLVLGATVYGVYLWRLECPRLLALWRQQES